MRILFSLCSMFPYLYHVILFATQEYMIFWQISGGQWWAKSSLWWHPPTTLVNLRWTTEAKVGQWLFESWRRPGTGAPSGLQPTKITSPLRQRCDPKGIRKYNKHVQLHGRLFYSSCYSQPEGKWLNVGASILSGTVTFGMAWKVRNKCIKCTTINWPFLISQAQNVISLCAREEGAL